VIYVSPNKPPRATDSIMLDEESVLLSYRGDELAGITVLDAGKRGEE